MLDVIPTKLYSYAELARLGTLTACFLLSFTRKRSLVTDAFDEQLAFQRALREFVGGIDSAYLKEHDEFHIGFEGSFGSKHVTPRTLSSRFIGNLVCVEGIVTKCQYLA